eukprot:802074-Amphidinium_carterae.1
MVWYCVLTYQASHGGGGDRRSERPRSLQQGTPGAAEAAPGQGQQTDGLAGNGPTAIAGAAPGGGAPGKGGLGPATPPSQRRVASGSRGHCKWSPSVPENW